MFTSTWSTNAKPKKLIKNCIAMTKSESNEKRERCKIARGLTVAVSAMTLTTTDDIIAGCQTRVKTRSLNRGELALRSPPAPAHAFRSHLHQPFACAIFTSTPQTIKLNVNSVLFHHLNFETVKM